MRPAIFIHINKNTSFLDFCNTHFKDKCDIIVNCYGSNLATIEYCKKNSMFFHQILKGSKQDIAKLLPYNYNDGVLCCNDDVVIEGDVWQMFTIANQNKDFLDFIYPAIDSETLYYDKIIKHKRHRLYTSCIFFTKNGIEKLRNQQPFAYSYTYCGVRIIHSKEYIQITDMQEDSQNESSIIPSTSKRGLLYNIANIQSLLPVTTLFCYTKKKCAIITLTTSGRTFLQKTYDNIARIAQKWNVDFKVYTEQDITLTKSQSRTLERFESKRENILNYFLKMLCINDALTQYDRVLWIDDTCVISTFTQNIFNVVPHECIGGLIIKPAYETRELSHDTEFIKNKYNVDINSNYINSGVVVVSKTHRSIFGWSSILQHIDLFQSFYPTQAYLAYKFTIDNIKLFDITCINHFMPAWLQYENSASMDLTDISDEHEFLASKSIIHFSGFHRQRSVLHANFVDYINTLFNTKITLVVMNFSRPKNVLNELLPFYTSIPAIDQIIVSHCKDDCIFNYSSNTCTVTHRNDVSTNARYGLFTRFIAAAESAHNECIVFVDDDLLVPSHVLSRITLEWLKCKNNVVGTRGRTLHKKENNWEYYANSPFQSECDIILTHCAMTSRALVTQLVRHEKYFHDVAILSKIKWNGEDIFLSLFALFFTQRKNKCIQSKYIELDKNNTEVCLSEDHFVVRTRMVNKIYNHYSDLIQHTISNSF